MLGCILRLHRPKKNMICRPSQHLGRRHLLQILIHLKVAQTVWKVWQWFCKGNLLFRSLILLMEEFLHQLGCIKPVKQLHKLPNLDFHQPWEFQIPRKQLLNLLKPAKRQTMKGNLQPCTFHNIGVPNCTKMPGHKGSSCCIELVL